MHISTAVTPVQRDLSPERHASLEQRIRQRVVTRCVVAARMAIAERRFHDAEVSLAEASSLDPEHPDVRELSAELLQRRHEPPTVQQPADPLSADLVDHPYEPIVRQTRTRWWPLAAVAVLAFVTGWTSIARLAVVLSQPARLPAAAEAPAPDIADVTDDRAHPDPAPVVLPPVADGADAPALESSPISSGPPSFEGTRRTVDNEDGVVPSERPVPSAAAPLAAPIQRATNDVAPAVDVRPAMATPSAVDFPKPIEAAPSTAAAAPAAATALEPSRTAAATTSDVVAPVAEVVRTDESQLVTRALQRYRAGYDKLDADLVQTVYPAVDRSPLSRAFKDLASQSLVFDACDVAIRGTVANATCRGTASYVPRIGSPEPRVERRVWTFTLRRGENDWTIESARTSR